MRHGAGRHIGDAPLAPWSMGIVIGMALGLLYNVQALRKLALAPPAEVVGIHSEAELGRRLFFDPRLSADGTTACSTCHDPARAFSDGRAVSVGVGGRVGQRNAPTIVNALFNVTQQWDG